MSGTTTNHKDLKTPSKSLATLRDSLPNGFADSFPGNETACSSCPKSLWHSTLNDNPACFCPVLRMYTWTQHTGAAIGKWCDGKELEMTQKAEDERSPEVEKTAEAGIGNGASE